MGNKSKATVGATGGWLKLERTQIRCTFAVMYILLIFIPACYTIFNKIPPLEDLRVATGVFSYKKMGLRFGNVVILNEDVTNYYTCRVAIGTSHGCFAFNAELLSMVGKPVQIWWYEQKLYFWYSQRRLVRLVVDGHEERSYEKSVSRDKEETSFRFYSSIVALAFIVALCVLLERIGKRQTQTKGEFERG
ncbi:MAG: hypothetical protein FWH42_06270 [Dehalococcoidia bacterium]|nr:hypothetical protein [Dehalococcoidia bacterium]